MKKLFSLILAMAVALSMGIISPCAAGVFDGAGKMKAMELYTVKVYTQPKYYKFNVTANGTFIFRHSGVEYKFMSIPGRLLNPNAEVIWEGGFLNREIKIPNVKVGTYYLELRYGYDSDKDNTMYDLYYTFEPDDKPIIDLKISLKKGAKFQLGSSVADYKGKISWISTKKGVATVSDKGLVTAHKKGTATIRATLDNGAYAQIKVTVS